MPYIIKNGLTYTGNLIPITQAQYEALSEAEKNNGIAYFIVDSDAVLDASDVGLGEGNVEDLAGSVATIETSPTVTNHVVGEHILWNGQLYEVISAIGAGADLTVNTNISARSVGEELSTLKNGLTWKRLLNVTTTANAQYDQTVTVENIANYNEIMLTVQRNSNGRTFATSACPVTQFQNAGLYAGGSYVLYSGQMQSNGSRWINAVAIWQANTSIEIAVNANDEALTVRVFVR